MPRGPVHDFVEKMILGKVTGMSQLMDAPSAFLHGQHRRLFHSVPEVMMLSFFLLDRNTYAENVFAGLLHIALDEMFSETKSMLTTAEKMQIKQKEKELVRMLRMFMEAV